MKVRGLGGTNFMAYDSFAVDLPARGIVLVTGKNGEGKSCLIEAVSVAGWGKTLRGVPWWREGQPAEALLTLDRNDIVARSRTKGGKNKIEIDGPRFDNASKAKASVESIVGDRDVWRKTCVFTSSSLEGASLSDSTDGDRKKLIETILGLTKFGPALDACRADMKSLVDQVAAAQAERERHALQQDSEERRREEAAASRKALEAPSRPPDGSEADTLAERVRGLEEEVRGLRGQRREAVDRDADIRAQIRALENQAGVLAQDRCITCGQDIPDALRQEVARTLADAETTAEKVRAEADEDLSIIEAQLEELAEDIASLNTKRASASQAARDYSRLKTEADRLDAIIREATLASTRHLTKKTDASARRNRLTKEQHGLAAVEKVLGLKGVRAHVLAHTLDGLARVTNKWLGRMGGLSIDLKPDEEKGTIILDVDGAGAGYGYKACSTGQRRRIDVALLLGLAALASAAHGHADSTLWFDEVFDILDDEGVIGVASCLEEMARDRCVVVISHSALLQQHIQPAVHLLVDGGSVFEV